jgi:hypothetical protein
MFQFLKVYPFSAPIILETGDRLKMPSLSCSTTGNSLYVNAVFTQAHACPPIRIPNEILSS